MGVGVMGWEGLMGDGGEEGVGGQRVEEGGGRGWREGLMGEGLG